jgi:hypothetical protein
MLHTWTVEALDGHVSGQVPDSVVVVIEVATWIPGCGPDASADDPVHVDQPVIALMYVHEHVQTPLVQFWPAPHVPQLPPHPLGPQFLPAQFGTHVQTPLVQVWFAEHVPQLPPQPLSPQVLPAQFGTHVQIPLVQVWPVGQFVAALHSKQVSVS